MESNHNTLFDSVHELYEVLLFFAFLGRNGSPTDKFQDCLVYSRFPTRIISQLGDIDNQIAVYREGNTKFPNDLLPAIFEIVTTNFKIYPNEYFAEILEWFLENRSHVFKNSNIDMLFNIKCAPKPRNIAIFDRFT